MRNFRLGLLALGVAAFLIADTAAASHTGGMLTMAVDVEQSGNTSSVLGSQDTCRRINENGLLDANEDVIDGLLVDTTANGINPYDDNPPAGADASDEGGITAYTYTLTYSAANLTVEAQVSNIPAINILVRSGGSVTINGDQTPDDNADNTWTSSALDTVGTTPEAGNGVLDRLTIVSEASSAPGVYNLTLSDNAHSDAAGDFHSPDVTSGASVAIDTTCPITALEESIDHIVVLMQENRSFDHYLGKLYDYNIERGTPLDVEPLPANASSPNPSGGPSVKPFHQTLLCDSEDVAHGWPASHEQWDNGANSGFATTNSVAIEPSGRRAMSYYTEDEIPYYYELYSTFAIGDRYFQSLLGPTYPNRFYLLAGGSYIDTDQQFAETTNRLPMDPQDFKGRSIFNSLDEAGVTWKVYGAQPVLTFANEFAYARNHVPPAVLNINQYYADAAAGTLPQVTFIDPFFIASKNVQSDEHPVANIQVGQDFVHDAIDALMTSPNWSSSALFLTYDEHGGYYDHVPPPPAPLPHPDPANLVQDLHPPTANHQPFGTFDRYGFRVPVAVVSPFAKAHYVSHVTHDHTSILRFIETRFGLPALTNRTANADPMLEFFDFANPPFATPPTLPVPTVDLNRPECEEAPVDGDTDGTGDPHDTCPLLANANQADYDADGEGDACDNCTNEQNSGQENVVHPLTVAGDHCDDPDGDGDFDAFDNCPDAANSGQENFDGDPQGDACDNDDDNDSVFDLDELNCGGSSQNAGRRPERIDDPFDNTDDDGDTQVDEPLPAGANAFDCDGDHYTGSEEFHVFGGLTTGDQDACGTAAWPADIVDGPLPAFALNRVQLPDLSSYILPVRRYNTSPGDTDFDIRWDLVPGATVPFPKHINLGDLQRLAIYTLPPMFGGGTRAFNGAVCPWPP